MARAKMSLSRAQNKPKTYLRREHKLYCFIMKNTHSLKFNTAQAFINKVLK